MILQDLVKQDSRVMVDESDLDEFRFKTARVSNRGYLTLADSGKYKLFHLFLNISTTEVDHRNGNKLDNRRDNLRPATRQQNLFNRVKHLRNTSGYKGVSWNKNAGKWSAFIGLNGRKIHLGYYDVLEYAAMSYNRAAVKYFGDFCKLNEVKFSINYRSC